ncbi:glutamine synthetase family protein [Pseudomonas cavernicola]|uniref:glutamine synthetase family protein n=1 Tax=Pseudomonas cavernicola TaxID=2320866 RepID=UPI0011C45E2E|nr:glutamine synthetase family protein [Pseudomonas cavernicola]
MERIKTVDLNTLQEAGINIVQMETVDLDGVLRGKFLPASKVKPDALGGFCSVVYQLTPSDDIWMTQHSSFENGFPDMIAVPDVETAIQWSWKPEIGAVIFDMQQKDGSPHPLAPRSVLKRVATRFAETGYQPVFGIEFEAFVMHRDEDLMAAGRHHEMKPFGQMRNAYRLNEAADVRDLAAAFITRMREAGIPVEVFHTELGYGAVEFALSPADPVRAADNATRAKTYFRQLCAERGLAATFMAKWKVGESGSGGHVHQSIWQNGENAFYGENGAFSSASLSYGAGLLKTMPDFSVIFRPNVNSYRRFSHKSWSPENASWGKDNRSAALRILGSQGRNAYRFEHRVPGADTNLYLSLAAMLAGGHYGLTHELSAPAFAEGNAALNTDFANLPKSLLEANRLFRESDIAKDYFGELFVEHYAASRENEWQHWLDWQAEQVTSFELNRYFSTL